MKHVLPGTVSASSGNFVPDFCSKYVFNSSLVINENETCSENWFDDTQERCNRWVFDENERTIVNDVRNFNSRLISFKIYLSLFLKWNVTCLENQWKLALVGTMHFAGIMAGSGIFGFLADRYGRKKLFIIAIVFMCITGVGQAVSINYIMFLSFAFLNAVGTSGVYPLAFVLGVEMVGKKKREMSGIVLNYFYSIGEAMVGFIAWLDGDWVNLQYWVSAPPILFIAYYWIIPESIRWLLAKKRNQKAFKIIKTAAKNNGVELSQNILTKFDEDGQDEDEETKSMTGDGDAAKPKAASYGGMMKSRILVIRSAMQFFIW